MNPLLAQLITVTQDNLYSICKYLSTGHEHTIQQILNALARKGVILNTNSSVVYKYMNRLKELEIVNVRIQGKTQYFSLNRQYNVVSGSEIGDKNTPFLVSLQKTLSKYQTLPVQEELEILINRSMPTIIDEGFMIIDFETADHYEGHEFLNFLYYKITECEMIQFQYQKFSWPAPKEVELQPYLLKEYAKRWYLVGRWKGSEQFVTYPLDRITEINWEYEGAVFERDPTFDPHKRWQNCVGIFFADHKPSQVSFELKNNEHLNIEYLKTAKIHASQKEKLIDEEWIQVNLRVVISMELVREIRKWGVHNMRNIKPKKLDKMVRFE